MGSFERLRRNPICARYNSRWTSAVQQHLQQFFSLVQSSRVTERFPSQRLRVRTLETGTNIWCKKKPHFVGLFYIAFLYIEMCSCSLQLWRFWVILILESILRPVWLRASAAHRPVAYLSRLCWELRASRCCRAASRTRSWRRRCSNTEHAWTSGRRAWRKQEVYEPQSLLFQLW